MTSVGGKNGIEARSIRFVTIRRDREPFDRIVPGVDQEDVGRTIVVAGDEVFVIALEDDESAIVGYDLDPADERGEVRHLRSVEGEADSLDDTALTIQQENISLAIRVTGDEVGREAP